VIAGDILMADGNTARCGDSVYNYYDGCFVTITSGPEADGWFDTVDERGRTKTLNGERISKRPPREQRFWYAPGDQRYRW
jgi:hypothetical protein